MAAAQHRAALKWQSEYLKGKHRNEHVPKASPFGPGSRPSLGVLVAQHGRERGEALFYGAAASRASAATLVRRGRGTQKIYDGNCLQFGNWAEREGFGARLD